MAHDDNSSTNEDVHASRKSDCLDGAERHDVNAQHHESAVRDRQCGFLKVN